MGDDRHGHAVLGQIPHEIQHLAHHFGVKGGGGLVEEHDLRIHGQRPDDGDTLLLTTGEHVGILVGLIGQTDTLQQGARLGFRLGGGLFLQRYRRQRDVLEHGLVGKQVEMLEHHAHLLAVEVDVHRLAGQIHAVEEDGAGGRLLQHVQAAQQRGLAGTGGADDGHHLALVDVQVTAIQRVNGAVVVLLHQTLHGDENFTACRHGAFSFLWPRSLWRRGS